MKRKLGKKQKAIAEKYSHILERLAFRDTIAEKKSTIRSLRHEIKSLSRELNTDRQKVYQLRVDRVSGDTPRQSILQVHETHNRLREARRTKYELELDVRTSNGYIKVGKDKIALSEEPLTDEQLNILDRLERRLESYSTGDTAITTFYHKYEFDIINETTLRLFAKGEGLI